MSKSLIKKIIDLRKEFHAEALKKGGKNSYYSYFELEDFIPKALALCETHGVLPIVSYGIEMAKMTIYDSETAETIEITSPMSSCSLKGCFPVQNLGSVETYLRRYLWLTFLEIVQHDDIEKKTNPKKDLEEEQTTPKKEKEAEKEVKKPDTAKLIEALLKIAISKGYTEKDVFKKFPEGIDKYGLDQINKVIDHYTKGETKGIRCRNALIKKSGKSIIEINKVSQAKFELNFTSLTEEQMEAVKASL